MLSPEDGIEKNFCKAVLQLLLATSSRCDAVGSCLSALSLVGPVPIEIRPKILVGGTEALSAKAGLIFLLHAVQANNFFPELCSLARLCQAFTGTYVDQGTEPLGD
ncbi:unnamed protein product [Strongylus vulgaris]|uniref:Uncharacterized protein n=1 Tax=Strongylus vulgaris TaxID=40348 RepID=A0A3P7IB13_STRVU|nr:unnamed protein product [Strongylus vulgaris]